MDEESIEKLFEDFVNAIKNLPRNEVDKLYDNIKKLDELDSQNNENDNK